MKRLSLGSIIKHLGIDPPWNISVVTAINADTTGDGTSSMVQVKRPYTHPHKSFILFDEMTVQYPDPNLVLERE